VVDLLPEHGKAHAVVQDYVVAFGPRSPETVNTFRAKPTLGLDLVKQLLGMAEQLARRGTV
jgi:hypothetical protein